jgi:hypothetical protein
VAFIITYDFRFGLVDDEPVKKAACNTAENERKPKEPQLLKSPAFSGIYSRAL